MEGLASSSTVALLEARSSTTTTTARDVVVSCRVVTRDRYGAFKGTFRTRAYARVCTRDVAHGCVRAGAPCRGCARARVGGIRARARVRARVRVCTRVYARVRRD
jgi:hypothetical protein